MLRTFTAILLLLHGLFHLVCFGTAWGSLRIYLANHQIPLLHDADISRLVSLLWLLPFIGFWYTVVSLLQKKQNGWQIGLGSFLLSQGLILLYFKQDAWLPIELNLLLIPPFLMSFPDRVSLKRNRPPRISARDRQLQEKLDNLFG